MKWPLTFYTDSELLLGGANGGCARAFIIFIRNSRRDDVGIYYHELEHVKQSLLGLIHLPALLYLFYKPYRLWAEVQAYKVQARYYTDDRLPRFAATIATKYGLDVSEVDVLKLLRSE